MLHSCLPSTNTLFHQFTLLSYQESGRAGRDGEQADCILFYSYKDKKTLEMMMRKGSPNSASTRRKIDQLYGCVRYCEDEFRCRRTMQLEFFGETFDRSKCNGTCDNCKAGKEPERRDTTGVARTLLGLLADFQSKRNGRGVTLVQVSELFRGSKTKSIVGNLDTGRLTGYGAGSKYKKHDIDRIMHAMVFERLLVEESTETNGGFSVDYVKYGENADALLNGGRQFFVEFPKAQPARKAKAKSTKSAPASKKASKKKPASKASTGKRKSTGSAETPSAENGLQFQEAGDSSDDELLSSSPFSAFSANKVELQMILSQEQTKQLTEKIKKMTRIWALEEQEMGKNVHCKYSVYMSCHDTLKAILNFAFRSLDWNILSNDVVKSVAYFVPTSLDELSALGVLGVAKLKEYGERLVKIVIACLVNELGLDVDFVQRQRPVKRAKVPAKDTSGVPAGAQNIITIDDDEYDEFDEFGSGIDFSAIVIPSHSAASSAKNKSRHFG
jgi:superfamily II DNA helicase RecQ